LPLTVVQKSSCKLGFNLLAGQNLTLSGTQGHNRGAYNTTRRYITFFYLVNFKCNHEVSRLFVGAFMSSSIDPSQNPYVDTSSTGTFSTDDDKKAEAFKAQAQGEGTGEAEKSHHHHHHAEAAETSESTSSADGATT
jgi:hypothetical protein